MSDRYFVETPITGVHASLTGPEARHLARVMRAQRGDQVILFDGSGMECLAEITEIRRDEVEFDVLSRDAVDRELPFGLTLAVALPKGDRQKWLIEKAVELGVTRVIPLRAERSVVQPGEGALQRMSRWVIDASKQCGRNRLMDIAPPQTWPDLLETSGDIPLRLIAHPGSEDETGGPLLSPTSDVLAAIGPEGGFTDDEVAAARDAGWRAIDLGPRILRVETAATYLAAMLSLHQAEPHP
jgi:16S rRNA (uracil1498-N3)-methyltransferase